MEIEIEDRNFKIHPLDMIKHYMYENGSVTCFTGTMISDFDFYVLGDVFMKNVVSVFDVGAGEMRFAPVMS